MIIKVDNIILLGTSHVSVQSAKEIKKTIREYNPEVVGIELDENRLRKVLSSDEDEQRGNNFAMIKEYGVSGYLFVLIGAFVQKKVAKSLGIDPGIDMKTAYEEAKKNNIPVALIDKDIRKVLKKISALKFTQKIGMLSNLVVKSFKKENREELNFDVAQGVPDEKFIEKALIILKREVPLLYDILIEDRNKHMCSRIMRLRENHDGPILAVVGAGHLKGMEEILKKKIASESKGTSISFEFVIDND